MVQKSLLKTMVYSHRYKPGPPPKRQKSPLIINAFAISTFMVLQMHSKANPTEISLMITWTIALCSFSTIGAWMDDICCLGLVEFLCIWVPFSRCFVSTCTGTLLLGRHGGDATMIPLSCILFIFICIGNFSQKVNAGSGSLQLTSRKKIEHWATTLFSLWSSTQSDHGNNCSHCRPGALPCCVC